MSVNIWYWFARFQTSSKWDMLCLPLRGLLLSLVAGLAAWSRESTSWILCSCPFVSEEGASESSRKHGVIRGITGLAVRMPVFGIGAPVLDSDRCHSSNQKSFLLCFLHLIWAKKPRSDFFFFCFLLDKQMLNLVEDSLTTLSLTFFFL